MLLEDGSSVPADCIILATAKEGQCYVETRNLDGEDALKVKYAVPETESMLKADD